MIKWSDGCHVRAETAIRARKLRRPLTCRLPVELLSRADARCSAFCALIRPEAPTGATPDSTPGWKLEHVEGRAPITPRGDRRLVRGCEGPQFLATW